MNDVLTIYEAKTNLSKYVKRAEAGESFMIGAYGNVQAMIVPKPVKNKIKFGLMDKAWSKYNLDMHAFDEPDESIWEDFDKKEFVL
jgi:antitoxin (DNA-binding transcriptional repressor) of toxin-antitoxin stability system